MQFQAHLLLKGRMPPPPHTPGRLPSSAFSHAEGSALRASALTTWSQCQCLAGEAELAPCLTQEKAPELSAVPLPCRARAQARRRLPHSGCHWGSLCTRGGPQASGTGTLAAAQTQGLQPQCLRQAPGMATNMACGNANTPRTVLLWVKPPLFSWESYCGSLSQLLLLTFLRDRVFMCAVLRTGVWYSQTPGSWELPACRSSASTEPCVQPWHFCLQQMSVRLAAMGSPHQDAPLRCVQSIPICT